MRYRIHENNYYALRAKVDKLTKRANKLGVAQIIVRDVGEEMVEEFSCEQLHHHENSCPKIHVKYITVELEGETPKFKGWEFLATLQHAGEAGTVVRAVPGADIDTKDYREAAPLCEHCKQNRVRRDTFLVYNTKRRETKQVGSSCVKDFTGHTDPHALARYLEALAGAAELLAMGGGFDGTLKEAHRLDLEQFLATAAARVRVKGWLSRSKAQDQDRGGTATADMVLHQMLQDYGSQEQRKLEYVGVEEADVEEANKALTWAQAIDPDTDNDYLSNILVVSRVPAMELRSAGLAASIISSHQRELRQQVERDSDVAKGPGSHIGEVKERLTLTVTVLHTQIIETDWGTSHLYNFEDEAGNALVTFSSQLLSYAEKEAANGEHLIQVGETVKIKGTVKRHGEFRHRNQTVLNRVKVLGVTKPLADAGKAFDELCREQGVEVKS